jgi:predicted DNA-binding ribbon-helix-helix protein
VTLHRTQVLLEDWQFIRLQKKARQQGTSVAALLRSLVEKSLGGPPSKKGLDNVMGIGSWEGSGEDHDEELYGD